MAIVRTQVGSAKDKTGAQSIEIASVSLPKRQTLYGAVLYDTGSSEPVVTLGTDILPLREVGGSLGFKLALYNFYNGGASRSNETIKADWGISGAPTAKVMMFSIGGGVRGRDISKFNEGTGTNQSSGANETPVFAEELFVGFMASEGPVEDSFSAPQLSYISGQRDGTTGGVADTNLTLHEIYKIVSVIEATKARVDPITSRDWAVISVSYKPIYNVTVQGQVIVEDVHAATEADAVTLVENDFLSRFPEDYIVSILP